MLQALQSTVRDRFRAWMQKRLPAARSITLNQQRIFIFPSAAGWSFLVLLLVIFLAAINYQNNMIFALVFWLASAFVVTILHTYANFSGLSLTAVRTFPAFAGNSVRVDIKISRESERRYFDITLAWPDSETATVTLDRDHETTVSLHLPARRRGRLNPGRLLVETGYPLGLLRCWTWLDLDISALVYPRPLPGDWQRTASGDSEEGEAVIASGSDDFYAFRDYQPGDPLKHIAWKSYAKGMGLQTKQFAGYRERRLWLNWEDFTGDTETRLSQLCYWVLQLDRRGEAYGLRLPGRVIEPGEGEEHRQQLLRELALFRADRSAGR